MQVSLLRNDDEEKMRSDQKRMRGACAFYFSNDIAAAFFKFIYLGLDPHGCQIPLHKPGDGVFVSTGVFRADSDKLLQKLYDPCSIHHGLTVAAGAVASGTAAAAR